MSNELTTIAKRSSVIQQKQSIWEQEQKARFVELASDSTAKYSDVIEYAINEDKQNHKIARVNYRIKCFRDDGVFQLNKAIQKVFGTVVAQGEQQPSNSGEGDVQTIDITLANGQRLKCPFGDIALPGLGEDAQVSISYNEEKHDLVITGKCQVRFQSLIDDIIDETKLGLANNSIYKGQALEITDINFQRLWIFLELIINLWYFLRRLSTIFVQFMPDLIIQKYALREEFLLSLEHYLKVLMERAKPS